MPKKTLESDSDSSDSGPDDRNLPPPKKSKGDTKSSSSAKSSKPKKNDTEENRWSIDKLRFVNVREFRGRKSVDIREFYEKDGEQLPGRKGISLSFAQWKKLMEISDDVTAAFEG